MAKRARNHSRQTKPAPPANKSGATTGRLVGVLIAVSALISLYLLTVSWSDRAAAGCGPDSPCHRVLNSRWASWLGVPVSLLAILAYAAILSATFGVMADTSPSRRKAAQALLTVLAVTIAGSALWFIGLQVFVLRSVCPYCMAAHGFGLVAAAIVLFKMPDAQTSKKIRTPNRPTENPSWRHVVHGLGCVAILIAGQVMYQPKTSAITQLPGRGVVTTAVSPTDRPTNRTASPSALSRTISLHDGQFELNLTELPLIGSPNAPQVMVSLFDYTCRHCQEMHGVLIQAQAEFTNQLAIVCLPMPQDTNCNPVIKRTPDAHVNACEYARLGLGVWRADRAAFRPFDTWVFGHRSVPPLSETRRYAEQLVGEGPLQRALADEWVDRQIARDVAIYEVNYRKTHSGIMPQIIVGSRIGLGSMSRVEDLFRLLESELGLKRPG